MIEVRGLTNTALSPMAPRRVIIGAFQTTRRRGLLPSGRLSPSPGAAQPCPISALTAVIMGLTTAGRGSPGTGLGPLA
jgi:hypothetical protein